MNTDTACILVMAKKGVLGDVIKHLRPRSDMFNVIDFDLLTAFNWGDSSVSSGVNADMWRSMYNNARLAIALETNNEQQ